VEAEIKLGDITVDVMLKDIKNIHLSVYPPTGRVRISAPLRFDLDTIRLFAIAKLGWIKKQQTKFRNQVREPQREFIERESHYFFGKRYLLRISETELTQTVILRHAHIEMVMRPGHSSHSRELLLNKWYRQQLKTRSADLIHKWANLIGIPAPEFGVKRMRTKWGSCNQKAGRIWINLELAKKPPPCLEYIVVHELVHLLERNHGQRFISLMDQYLPQWRQAKAELNRLPVAHADWFY
jgi:predicted metal-dependent hydrolase